jgi:hypothetical protein
VEQGAAAQAAEEGIVASMTDTYEQVTLHHHLQSVILYSGPQRLLPVLLHVPGAPHLLTCVRDSRQESPEQAVAVGHWCTCKSCK